MSSGMESGVHVNYSFSRSTACGGLFTAGAVAGGLHGAWAPEGAAVGPAAGKPHALSESDARLSLGGRSLIGAVFPAGHQAPGRMGRRVPSERRTVFLFQDHRKLTGQWQLIFLGACQRHAAAFCTAARRHEATCPGGLCPPVGGCSRPAPSATPFCPRHQVSSLQCVWSRLI